MQVAGISQEAQSGRMDIRPPSADTTIHFPKDVCVFLVNEVGQGSGCCLVSPHGGSDDVPEDR
jgi:hypothetical protein